MDPRIYATYVKVLKYGWDIELGKLSRLIGWFIGRPYAYRLIGTYVFQKGDIAMHFTNAIEINLKSASPKIHEYVVSRYMVRKTQFKVLP